MTSRRKLRGFAALIFLISSAVSACNAEELTLKDGGKIVGTIVGYENDMFRVETEFGFALVRKDKVASVNFRTGGGKEALQKGKAPVTGREKANERVSREPASSFAANVRTGIPAEGSSPAVSQPMNEPLPPHLQEHVEGNNYINDTFHFAMFKPPGWKIFEGVPRETGSGIVAIGTEDEQTLLVVDRQVWTGTPDLKNDLAEANLRGTYQDYQKLFESPLQLDGQPAVRRVFRGVMEGVEWHGVSVQVARGNAVFGIMGLTSAETFGFQQAIFDKIIKSFHFFSSTTQAPPSPSARTSQSPATL